MKLIVGNKLTIIEPTEAVRKWCKKNLIVANPEYAKKERMGFWVGNTPRTLELYEHVGDDELHLPYGCLAELLEDFDFDDIKTTFDRAKRVEFGGDVPLYDYQELAVEEMFDAQYGILQSPAGSGKTQMGIALASRFGTRCLWLTHTKDLLNQSKERASLYMDSSKFGTITEGRVKIGETFTFATIQTMAMLDLEQYKDMWDVIIVDECHRVSGSPTAVTRFSKVLNSLRARHKYGLSATVHRADGLIVATFAILGGIAYIVPEEEVADKIMRVSVQPRLTGVANSYEYLNSDGTINWQKQINYLVENEFRNRVIATDLTYNADHYNLILSDRVNHLYELQEMLAPDLRELSAVIDGKMTSKTGKAKREGAIQNMRDGTARYLFATFSLAKEGLDIPRLDRVYFTTPQSDYAVVTQAVGRIDRAFEGKEEPIVYDYIDSIRNLEKKYKKRCTTYRKLKCEIKESY